MMAKGMAGRPLRVMVLGVGSFSQSVLKVLREDGTEVAGQPHLIHFLQNSSASAISTDQSSF